MADQSPNLNLPYIAPAQAQKHVTHNEALQRLDAIVQLSVIAILNAPPEGPEDGQRVLVGDAPEDDYDGQANSIAVYDTNAWRFITPQTGWSAFVVDIEQAYVYSAGVWKTLTSNTETETGTGTGTGGGGDGAPQETAPRFGVNATADDYNRLNVRGPASLFDNEGNGHQLKINKAAASDTASLMFQSAYSGHAEIGLMGGQDLHFKTSPDGSAFKDSLIAKAGSGAVIFPQGTDPEIMLPSLTESGGDGYSYGVPNTTAVYTGRHSHLLTKNNMYFTAFYVDRPTLVTGGVCVQYASDSVKGSVIRAGIYKLGSPNGDDWQLGSLAADFGALPSHTVGAKIFESAVPVTLEKGWYASAIGTNSNKLRVRYARILQGGQAQITITGSSSSSDINFCGPSTYMYSKSSATELVAGLSPEWPLNPITCKRSANSYGYLMFIPRWKAW